MAGAFLHQQQGGGWAQRLVDRSFTKEITLDIRPCPVCAIPSRLGREPAVCPRALVGGGYRGMSRRTVAHHAAVSARRPAPSFERMCVTCAETGLRRYHQFLGDLPVGEAGRH